MFEANAGLSFAAVIDRWLTGEAEVADPELAALAHAMFDANPELRALSGTHLTRAADVGLAALLAELDLPADHPMVNVVGGAIGGAINEYIATISLTGPRPDFQRSFVAYLRALIGAGKSGEPTLQPG